MATQRVTPTTPLVLRSRRSVEQFKVCTLCGALNVKENDECFVCRWSGEFDLDGPLPPMITRSEDVDVRVPLGPYQQQKLAALTAHRSQVNLDDPFWKLMTGMDGLGESFLLATGVRLPNGTATDLFEGLDLQP